MSIQSDTVEQAVRQTKSSIAIRAVEWPTLCLAVACYGVWALATTWLAGQSLLAGVVIAALCVALQSSLQHEALHGHPFRLKGLNAALVFPAMSLVIPYGRFRDTHLDHHRDPLLTDPYDDPETNYLDPAIWDQLARWRQRLLIFNNTLLGRMVLGTALGQIDFMRGDWRAIRAGQTRVIRAWLWHIPALALVFAWLGLVGQMPFWAYVIAAYSGLSLIKIRTFLEHRAHVEARGRTVIIEDRGPLALLFLNNNLHAVHHARPGIPWYRLPQTYAANRAAFLRANDGYVYRSYVEIARKYLLRTKDTVAHPNWR